MGVSHYYLIILFASVSTAAGVTAAYRLPVDDTRIESASRSHTDRLMLIQTECPGHLDLPSNPATSVKLPRFIRQISETVFDSFGE